jgi:hypothetical protein
MFVLEGVKAMASHILVAAATAIALSTPAWADDPAEAPIDTEIKAILLDPAEAPIDTEMKIILWLESIEASSREHIAAGGNTVRSGLCARGAGRTGPTIAEYQSAPTNANVAAE